MYDTEKEKENNNSNNKREIFTGKMDPRGRKKTYEKGPIDINIKIKEIKHVFFFLFIKKRFEKDPRPTPSLPPLHHHPLDYLHDPFDFIFTL